MKKYFLLILICSFLTSTTQVQFTSNFISNPIRYNTAFTGEQISLLATNFYSLSRYTEHKEQMLNFSMPLFKNRVGIGVNIMNLDYLPQSSRTSMDISVAY